MTKINKNGEYIFNRKGYEKDKKKFEEWSEHESMAKRILYFSEKYSECTVEYIRIKKEEGMTLISLIREKINVFHNSEFIKKQCLAYIKIDYKEKKIYNKKWGDVLYEIKLILLERKKNEKILDLLGIDFLKQKNKNNYSNIFSYISNDTIFKNLMLGKITNEKDLFKAYFKSRFNAKIDKLPLSKAREIVDKKNNNLFFKILNTSKNAHITINNYKAIIKYPHIHDLSREAYYLKEKINYNRSRKSLNEIHSQMSVKIAEILKGNSKISKENIYELKEAIPPKYNFHLLQTELDFFIEGTRQKHCVYNYYGLATQYLLLKKEEQIKDENKNVSFFFSYREEYIILATLEVVFKWNYKTKKFEDDYWFHQIYGKRNEPLQITLEEKIKKDFEKYYREVLIKQLIPIEQNLIN